MLSTIKKTINRQSFFPSRFGIFLNPFYFARLGLLKAIKFFAPNLSGRILDIGCGQKPYKELFSFKEYIGLEYDTPENRRLKKADIFYNGSQIPVSDSSFDSVIISQVFEHVFNPDSFLREVNRILKRNGILLLTVPFVWDEHELPLDYARYSSFGIKAILESNGFEIIDQKKTMADIRAIFQLINVYLYKITLTNNRIFNLFMCVVLFTPINLFGLIFGKILPKNDNLYLDNVVLAKKNPVFEI